MTTDGDKYSLKNWNITPIPQKTQPASTVTITHLFRLQYAIGTVYQSYKKRNGL